MLVSSTVGYGEGLSKPAKAAEAVRGRNCSELGVRGRGTRPMGPWGFLCGRCSPLLGTWHPYLGGGPTAHAWKRDGGWAGGRQRPGQASYRKRRKRISYREEAAQIEEGREGKGERQGRREGQGRVVARPFMARTRRGRQGVSPGT